MKELSIEEKAKLYDEAIERAKSLLSGNQLGNAWIYKLLLELAESEDEKMKKIISDILLIDSDEIREILDTNNVLMQDIDAWLEKQGMRKDVEFPTKIVKGNTYLCVKELKFKERPLGAYAYFKVGSFYKCKEDLWLGDEHNCRELIDGDRLNYFILVKESADKIEPKFKVGDWVVGNNGPHHIFQVIERSWPNAKYRNIDGAEIFLNVNTLDKQYHLWTIQDAKDGDVLVKDIYPDGMSICIFKGMHTQPFTMKLYCSIDEKGQFFQNYGDYYHRYDVTICPATKEQRDLLFQKMKEAGYVWDAEKKELKKIEQKPTIVPKFRVGDKIWHKSYKGECMHHIIRIENNNYIGDDNTSISISTADKEYELVEKLWKLQGKK